MKRHEKFLSGLQIDVGKVNENYMFEGVLKHDKRKVREGKDSQDKKIVSIQPRIVWEIYITILEFLRMLEGKKVTIINISQ